MLDFRLARLAETVTEHDSLFLWFPLVHAHVTFILQWPLWQSVEFRNQPLSDSMLSLSVPSESLTIVAAICLSLSTTAVLLRIWVRSRFLTSGLQAVSWTTLGLRVHAVRSTMPCPRCGLANLYAGRLDHPHCPSRLRRLLHRRFRGCPQGSCNAHLLC